MKMIDVFELPVNGVAHHVSIEQNEAAAHAINCHDELVEALTCILKENKIIHSQRVLAESALSKARGEL